MQIDVSAFRVDEGDDVSLHQRPTEVDPFYKSKSNYKDILADHVSTLSKLQEDLYRSAGYALLLVLQGMDTAGKDGAIAHVMSGVNPQGCKIASFKQPSSNELLHDFLWRCARELPERGIIGVFNRSYYEPVLVIRVHPELLREEGIHDPEADLDAIWADRYRSIRDFERHLHVNHTRVVKIFLHISKEEQLRRLQRRLDTPEKSWKITRADALEREYWKDYINAYEHALSETSAANAPWWIVPADDKPNARLIVSQIVIDTLKGLNLTPPPIDAERKHDLKEIGKLLEK
ncbi:MAG TPA: PPK2 family polyphosphate kinase [Roseiarcus sp.]|jgi:PPK2 family polyphosphate:nucleotide phosphotransferase